MNRFFFNHSIKIKACVSLEASRNNFMFSSMSFLFIFFSTIWIQKSKFGIQKAISVIENKYSPYEGNRKQAAHLLFSFQFKYFLEYQRNSKLAYGWACWYNGPESKSTFCCKSYRMCFVFSHHFSCWISLALHLGWNKVVQWSLI